MNLYIHVPFCAQRCSYCDFYTQTNRSLVEQYLSALTIELRLRLSELTQQGGRLEHVYLGGGTPSLLSQEALARIISTIKQYASCSVAGEWTIECNPDDMTSSYAEGLVALGFNRVSMGVQSFQDEALSFLNRRHSVAQVYAAVEDLRRAGISNISLDLIYGLPKQSLESWADNLRQLLALEMPHVSAYHLIYEEGTPLTRLRDLGRVHEVSEDTSVKMLELLIDTLSEAGYEHYEVSNFALPGRYAQLNTGYWMGDAYLGCGPSAHSFDGMCTRSANPASIRQYVSALEQGILPAEAEVLSQENLRHEYLMTRLRTQWGIMLGDYANRWGGVEVLLDRAKPFLEAGQLSLDGEHRLRLTRSGIFVSDGIILALM